MKTGPLTSHPGRITAAGIKYMRNTAGFTWTDYKTKAKIAKELNITPVLEEYRTKEEIGCNIQTECPVIDYRGK
jgi:hypothetical protein